MNKNEHLHNPDIPYEQRMKYIIEDYRRLLDWNERLAAYARALEEKVKNLEEDVSVKWYKNSEMSRRLIEKNRECKRLKAHIEWLEEQLQKKS